MRMNAQALTALVVALLFAGSMATASVFDTIDFEQSEGYSAPAALATAPGGSMDNIATGGDFADTNYGTNPGTWMLAWNGVDSDSVDYGVASGLSAFLFDSNSRSSYARTSVLTVPNERQDDRFFTVDYNSLVLVAEPGNAPPSVRFWFNSATASPYVQIHHTYSNELLGTRNITLRINGTTNLIQNHQYVFQEWASERLVFDSLLDTVSYYYNGSLFGSYGIGAIESFRTYGVGLNNSQARGQIAVDNIRFGTEVPEPGALIALLVGVTALIPAIRRKRQ